MAEQKKLKVPHSLILKDRKSLNVTGVSDVDSFDDQVIVVYTDYGELTVKGSGLHIDSLDLSSGELTFNGKINSMIYTENKPKSMSLFSKIFK